MVSAKDAVDNRAIEGLGRESGLTVHGSELIVYGPKPGQSLDGAGTDCG